MSNESLFSKHVALLTQPESTWTAEQKAEWEKINSLELPPLKLPKAIQQTSLWENWKQQWHYGLSALAMASLALLVIVPQLRNKEDTLTAKGAIQISVYWERGGKVSPLNETSELIDGDKIGAKIISGEDSTAYWTITDKDLKVLDDIKEIESSRMNLSAGVSQNFNSGFQLVAPNQGENLVIIVCPKQSSASFSLNDQLVLDHKFLTEVIEKQNKKANDCMYAGFRLRKAP